MSDKLYTQSEVDTLVAAARRETWEKAIGIPMLWVKSPSCTAHDENPCCHVRLATTIVEKLEAAAKEVS